MKRIFFLLVFGATLLPLVAQDTLVSKVPPSNYYYTRWIETSGTGYLSSIGCSRDIPLLGIGSYTKDSLAICGIAAAIEVTGVLDTNTCIWLDLHKPQSGRLVPLSDTLSIYPGRDAPSYWFKMDMVAHPPYYTPLPVRPVYEAFFDEPVVVAMDSFYVCMIDSLSDMGAREDLSWPLGVVVYRSTEGAEDFKQVIEIVQPGGNVIYEYKTLYHFGQAFLFPIIDTTSTPIQGGGDTVSISQPSLPERCVLASPNPAQSQARVTSSIGMSLIEVYSMSGDRMATYSAEGMSRILDLSSFPDGVYILKVHTPMGIATKKLVVQRK